jgi:hypothetical protein
MAMPEKVGGSELWTALVDALRIRLEPAGWMTMVAEDEDPVVDADFVHPIDAQFTATAEVIPAAVEYLPLSITAVRVGIAYEPLRRAWPLLGRALRASVLADDVHRDLDAAGNDRGDECVEDLDEDGWELEIADLADVPRAADELARPILAHGVRRARALASVDAIIARLAADEEPSFVDWRVPALLAAAGRLGEARDALAQFEAGRQTTYTRRLRRWIDSGLDPSLIPARGEPGPAAHAPAKRKFS